MAFHYLAMAKPAIYFGHQHAEAVLRQNGEDFQMTQERKRWRKTHNDNLCAAELCRNGAENGQSRLNGRSCCDRFGLEGGCAAFVTAVGQFQSPVCSFHSQLFTSSVLPCFLPTRCALVSMRPFCFYYHLWHGDSVFILLLLEMLKCLFFLLVSNMNELLH